jgi:hypothetical protein
MPGRKQIYKITYSNGKIYAGMDLTGRGTAIVCAVSRIGLDDAAYTRAA